MTSHFFDFVRLRRQQFCNAAFDTVAAQLAINQFLLEIEAHQVFACNDADHATRHVDHHQVTQAQCSEDDVGAMQREVLLDSRRWVVDVRLKVDVDVFVVRRVDELLQHLDQIDAARDAIDGHLWS